jgi:hypothetical protein
MKRALHGATRNAQRATKGRSRYLLLLLILLGSVQFAHAATVFYDRASERIVLADETSVRSFDAASLRQLWRVEFSGNDPLLSIDPESHQIAVTDRLKREVVFLDHRGKAIGRRIVEQFPVAALALNDGLLYTTRAGSLIFLEPSGASRTVAELGPEAAFLRRRGEAVVAYSRTSGKAVIVDSVTLRALRTLSLAPYGSDLEIDGRYGYVTYPRRGKLAVFPLAGQKSGSAGSFELESGAVPVDAVLSGTAGVTTAGEVIIADPSSKRIWRSERQQSLSEAVARGFVRGLLGLGIQGASATEFPTGIDRVALAGTQLYAFDSSAATLYRLERKRSSKVLTGIAFTAIAFLPDGHIVYWDDTTRQLRRL